MGIGGGDYLGLSANIGAAKVYQLESLYFQIHLMRVLISFTVQCKNIRISLLLNATCFPRIKFIVFYLQGKFSS